MQKTTLILVFILMTLASFSQNNNNNNNNNNNASQQAKMTPKSYGVYDDLDQMKQRFKNYVELQKIEKKHADAPRDEVLWEAAKGPEDFAAKKMITAYLIKKPVGYASEVQQEKVDKEAISKTIQNSLFLSKGKTTNQQENWQLKLKQN